MDTTGGRIRYYRTLKGLTQRELAEKTGLGRNAVMRYETGQEFVSLRRCSQLANILEIQPELLYDDYLHFIAGNYGDAIKRARTQRNLTQDGFAELINVMEQDVGIWERSVRVPSRPNFKKLQSFL